MSLVLGLAPNQALAAEVHVAIVQGGYDPSVATVARGDTVVWTNTSSGKHTSTSRPGPGLWGSRVLEQGRTYAFRFFAAGGFEYFCTRHASMDGRVDVPLSVRTRAVAGGTRVTVIIAITSAPEDLVYDVQRMTSPIPIWQDWQVGITARRASFVAEPGTYGFRARVRRLSTDLASEYSPEASVTI